MKNGVRPEREAGRCRCSPGWPDGCVGARAGPVHRDVKPGQHMLRAPNGSPGAGLTSPRVGGASGQELTRRVSQRLHAVFRGSRAAARKSADAAADVYALAAADVFMR